jgi:sterol desaturase/sphingolipid hydroxylase (fatty acid hydroxylase superfamily)
MTDGSGVDPWAQLHPPVLAIMETPEIPRSWYDLKPVLGQGMYALFGAFFLGVWFLRKRRLSQSYYLVLGALLLGLAALGTFLGVLLPELWNLKVASLTQLVLPPLAHLWLAMVLCGISMVLAGVLDHWQIARVLRPVGEA